MVFYFNAPIVFRIYEDIIYGQGRLADTIFKMANKSQKSAAPITAFIEDGAYYGFMIVLAMVSYLLSLFLSCQLQ
jgi:hypothetical protein